MENTTPISEGTILIVDDDQGMLEMLGKVIKKKSACTIDFAKSGKIAKDKLKQNGMPELILTDIKMPDMDGMELLKFVKQKDPTISVILMTGFGTVELAVQAIKDGAYDFLQKPFDNNRVIYSVKRAMERTRLMRENLKLLDRLGDRQTIPGFIGKSAPLREVYDLISRIANTDVTVLIRGESGTGKELAAKAIHQLSTRAAKSIITVNCPALPEHILESELFGYVKGAFTGANQDKKGLFLEANGSTILLDEIGDIPVSLQTKLLRVLQEKEIRPLGSNQDIKIDVRILASTNQNLEEKITQGKFREDLFYRLNVVTVTMPSLREIKDDIPLLARHFLKVFSEEYKRPDLSISPEGIRCLMRRPWNGNIRELQNVLKRAVLLVNDNMIQPEDLYLLQNEEISEELGAKDSCLGPLNYNQAKEKVLASFTKTYLSKALRRTGGNVTLAARTCGLERQAFQRLMRRYEIRSDKFREDNRKEN